MNTTGHIPNALIFNSEKEDRSIPVQEGQKALLQQVRLFENMTTYKLTFGEGRPFTKIINNFVEIFKPFQFIETFGFDKTAKKFLVAESGIFQVILFLGNSPSYPCDSAIFLRVQREEEYYLLEPNITAEMPSGKKLRYDYVCFYDNSSKHMVCEPTSLLSSGTELAAEPILELIAGFV